MWYCLPRGDSLSDQLSATIRRVTEELQALQSAIQANPLSRDSTGAAQGPDLDAVQSLKSAVDHMRHFLWAYLETAAAGENSQQFERTLQNVRMERTAELLRALKDQVRGGNASQLPAARSFFEEVQDIASRIVDRAQDGRST